ncbi:MAG TPA: LysR family transcriptional regulator [Rhizobium sp.]
MNSPNINSIDLNLLRVFDAIFREGNILRAAQRLGMSQPAASHALARLRHALDDELFVRSAQGMLPTARAEQLAEPIRQALSYLELGLQSGPFEPQSSTQKFKLALDNCSAVALTSKIVDAVGLAAPGVSLHLRPSGTIDVDRMIDAADLDMFIGRPGDDRERFASEELSSDDFVVVQRSGIRTACRGTTIDELTGTPHLHLSSAGDDTSFLDRWLAEQGVRREIKHAVPLLGCTAVLQQQDVFVVMRRPIADVICRGSGLTARELPFASPKISTCMRWHKRVDSQPAHAWLRDMIRSAAGKTQNLSNYIGSCRN